jgi:probable phosphoglycerate mutase
MAKQIQKVFAIRHGETEWSVSGQHTGITDLPLTDDGRRKAGLLQPMLQRESFVLVLVSPLRRAIETCKISGLWAEAQIDRDLMEWDYGEYEGLTSAQIDQKAPGWMLFTDGSPGGETPQQVSARVDRIIARARAAGGNVALFGHGHSLRVLAARWLGLTASAGSHFLLGTGTLNILSHDRGVPAIERWNCPVE